MIDPTIENRKLMRGSFLGNECAQKFEEMLQQAINEGYKELYLQECTIDKENLEMFEKYMKSFRTILFSIRTVIGTVLVSADRNDFVDFVEWFRIRIISGKCHPELNLYLYGVEENDAKKLAEVRQSPEFPSGVKIFLGNAEKNISFAFFKENPCFLDGKSTKNYIKYYREQNKKLLYTFNIKINDNDGIAGLPFIITLKKSLPTSEARIMQFKADIKQAVQLNFPYILDFYNDDVDDEIMNAIAGQFASGNCRGICLAEAYISAKDAKALVTALEEFIKSGKCQSGFKILMDYTAVTAESFRKIENMLSINKNFHDKILPASTIMFIKCINKLVNGGGFFPTSIGSQFPQEIKKLICLKMQDVKGFPHKEAEKFKFSSPMVMFSPSTPAAPLDFAISQCVKKLSPGSGYNLSCPVELTQDKMVMTFNSKEAAKKFYVKYCPIGSYVAESDKITLTGKAKILDFIKIKLQFRDKAELMLNKNYPDFKMQEESFNMTPGREITLS